MECGSAELRKVGSRSTSGVFPSLGAAADDPENTFSLGAANQPFFATVSDVEYTILGRHPRDGSGGSPVGNYGS